MTVAIVTDSTCDLPENVIRDLGITVIPLFINIGDQGYLDGIDISRKDLYKNLPHYPVHPTTGAPGTDAFAKTYRSLAAQGYTQVLSIHIAESLSATVKIARSAAHEMTQIPVIVHDSGELSMGTGFQVETAARLALEGKSMQEIQSALDDVASRTFVAARLNTLEHLRRSGRMNGLIAGLGSLLQLKPILTMQRGQAASERVRTTVKAQARLVEMLEEHQPVEQFVLLHTHAHGEAQRLCEQVSHLIPAGEVLSMDITPVIGIHLGPGAVGYAVLKNRPPEKS